MTAALPQRRRQRQAHRQLSEYLSSAVVMILMLVVIVAPTMNHGNQVQAASPTLSSSSASSSSDLMTFPLIPFEELARRRRLSLEQTALYRGLGTHYLDLYCGTPTPQLRTVTIDTGSGYIAFPCTGCQNCGSHLQSTFDPSASSTFHQVSCSKCVQGQCSSSSSGCLFSATYLEGDHWQAYEASDLCYAGDSSSAAKLKFNLAFGCQTQVTGFFVSQLEDGIMGMGNFNTSFWNQMYLSGKIKHAMFSVCYAPSDVLGTSSNGIASGVLVLGGTDTRLHTSTMIYSSGAITQLDPFFHVTVRNIYLQAAGSSNVVSLSLTSSQLNPTNGVIVDSGTTFSDLDVSWMGAFDQAWLSMVGTVFNQTAVTAGQLSSLPTLLFQFAGDSTANAQITSSSSYAKFMASSIDSQHPHDVIVAFAPSQYMQYDQASQMYYPILTFGQSGTAILGGNFIMQRDVLFDAENDRLGWATSQCSYSQVAGSGGAPSAPTSPNTVINRTPTMAPGGKTFGGGGGFFGLFSAAPSSNVVSNYIVLLGMLLAVIVL